MATKVVEVAIEQYDPVELEPIVSPPIPLSDWKAWSYYARPCVNGVEVDNLCELAHEKVFAELLINVAHLYSTQSRFGCRTRYTGNV